MSTGTSRTSHQVWPDKGAGAHYGESYVNLRKLHDALMEHAHDGSIIDVLATENAETTLVPREGSVLALRAYVRPMVLFAISNGKHGLSPFHMCSPAQERAIESQIKAIDNAENRMGALEWYYSHMHASNDPEQKQRFADKANELARERERIAHEREAREKDDRIAALESKLAELLAKK